MKSGAVLLQVKYQSTLVFKDNVQCKRMVIQHSFTFLISGIRDPMIDIWYFRTFMFILFLVCDKFQPEQFRVQWFTDRGCDTIH